MRKKQLLFTFFSLLSICVASCNNEAISSHFLSKDTNNVLNIVESQEYPSSHYDTESVESSLLSSYTTSSSLSSSSCYSSYFSNESVSNVFSDSSSNVYSSDDSPSSSIMNVDGNWLSLDRVEYDDGIVNLSTYEDGVYCISGFVRRRIISFELGHSLIEPGNYHFEGIKKSGYCNGKCCLQLFKKISENNVDFITQFGPDYGYTNIKFVESCNIVCRVICYPGWDGTILLSPLLKQIPQTDSCSVVYGNSRFLKPIISFVDDDGSKEFISKWLPIMDKYGVPVTCAVVTDWVDKKQSCLSWDELNYLKEKGAEIVCHTESHNRDEYVKMSVSDLTDSYLRAKTKLANHGFDTRVIVYCGDTGDFYNNRAAARKIFDIGILSGGNANKRENYNLYGIERYNALLKAHRTFDNYYKPIIDKAIANREWIIWMTHSQYSCFDDDAINEISKMIEYSISNDVSIVNISQGFELLVKD